MSFIWMGLRFADEVVGLRTTVTEGGIWRLQKREKTPTIDVFKLEETGTGDILSRSFLQWREHGLPEVNASRLQEDQWVAAENGNGVVPEHDPP